MPQTPRAPELTQILVVGGTDAPGFMIVPDGKGGYKIIPVPGWNPEQMRELSSALRVVAAAGRIKHAQASRTILNNAAKLAASEIHGLLGRADVAGGSVAVVVA
jgi:hypothetical protein